MSAHRWLARLGPVVVGASIASGCGSDHEEGHDGGFDNPPGAEGGSPRRDSGPVQSDAGPMPTGTSRTEGGSPGPLSCPEDGECREVGGLPGCCTSAGFCGARYLGASGAGCVRLDQDGRVDPTCPANGETTGCCRPTGTCGAFYSRTFGCVDPANLPDRMYDTPVPCALYGGTKDAGGD